jgi:hypothetical protein
MVDLTPETEQEKLALQTSKEKLYKNLLITLSFVSVISLTLSAVVSYMSIKHLRK